MDATRDEGLSPQVRGISGKDLRFAGRFGIIPAGAGHLATSPSLVMVTPDYPRRCGAFHFLGIASPSKVGLSPQVRGIWVAAGRVGDREGIIPAGAGHLLAELEYRSKIFLSNTIL